VNQRDLTVSGKGADGMSNSGPPRSKDGGKEGNVAARLVFTAVALSVAAAHLLWPHLAIDAVTVGLLIIALLPWASSFLHSVEALGVKAELRQQEQQIQEAKGAAESANRRAEFAEQYSAARESTAAEAGLDARSSPPHTDAEEVFAELAREYNEVRERMRSGSGRTAVMTRIVSRMAALAPDLAHFDVEHALGAKDPGSRLSAYAYLYACPNFGYAEALVDTVTSEDKPFNEYWGIRAIGRVLGSRPQDANIDMTVTKLRKHLENRLRPGTDRYYELSRILRELGQ
jgi:hypothetical protein